MIGDYAEDPILLGLFRYWDRKTNAPMPGLHDALFPRK